MEGVIWMGNGILKLVVLEVRKQRKRFEDENSVKVKSTEVLVKYDREQKFYIHNKKRTDEKKYPSNFKGDVIIRPFWDLKSVMFDYNGDVLVRFHYENSEGHEDYSDIKIGTIMDENFIYAK